MELFKKQKDVIVSFITQDKPFLNQKLLFVLNKDASTEMYLYPDMIQVEGLSSHSTSFLKKLKCETYDLRFNNQPVGFVDYQRYYYDSLNRIDGHSLDFSTLYYDPDDEKTLEKINEFKEKMAMLCDRLHINYCNDPKLLLRGLISYLDRNKVKTFEFSDPPRIDFCSSKEGIDKYVNEEIVKCNDKDSLDDLYRSLNDYVNGANYYIIDNYCYPMLSNAYLLDAAFNNKKYSNREHIIKAYMEFSVLFPYLCKILKHLVDSSKMVESKKDSIRLNDMHSDQEFIDEINALVNHEDGVTMYYHATSSIRDAKKILKEGLYSYSRDISFTTFAELDLDQILLYEYGNGVTNYGDVMIVIKADSDANIVRELSEEESENVIISPRRSAVCTPPTYVIDKKYIVGYIDKVNKKFIHNESFGLEDSIKKE